jgi:mannose-1-phosphate guanylyltransferase
VDRPAGHAWALVLAAGDGSRLSRVTAVAGGGHVPKQFCSFCSDRSLLAQTLERAARVVPAERIVVVVAAQHREYWEPELAGRPPGAVVVQPRNRGTANGLLLGGLAIRRRDPAASLLVLPSDHAFEDERRLRLALRRAQLALVRRPEALVLLGIEPDEPDTGYGWIVPGADRDALTTSVDGFVEKPEAARAAQLMAAGALWSSFILALRLQALLELYARRQPGLLRAFEGALPPGAGRWPEAAVERLYDELPPCDFSRELLQAETGPLRLLRVPPVGWTDLGTPERLRRSLEARRDRPDRPFRAVSKPTRAPLALEAALVAATA